MQIAVSMFSDPTQRAGLQQYYENLKSETIASLKTRENEEPQEVKFTTPDGEISTGTTIPISAEKMEASFVPFDKWLEITQQIYESQQKMYDMAQKSLDMLETQNPDSPSGVQSTFSHDGVLLAYINKDGSIATSNGAEKYVQSVIDKANDLGLTGQSRADYLHREVQAALSEHFKDMDVAAYNEQTSPTKREFADMFYTNFDIDQHYKDALAEAKASFESAKQWHGQVQTNYKKMQDFLLSFQETA